MVYYAFQQYTCLSGTAISLLGYTNGLNPDIPPNITDLGYTNGLNPDIPPNITIVVDYYANISISNDWEVTVNATVLQDVIELTCPLALYEFYEGVDLVSGVTWNVLIYQDIGYELESTIWVLSGEIKKPVQNHIPTQP
eukprot:sb/3474372/